MNKNPKLSSLCLRFFGPDNLLTHHWNERGFAPSSIFNDNSPTKRYNIRLENINLLVTAISSSVMYWSPPLLFPVPSDNVQHDLQCCAMLPSVKWNILAFLWAVCCSCYVILAAQNFELLIHENTPSVVSRCLRLPSGAPDALTDPPHHHEHPSISRAVVSCEEL